MAVTVTQEDNDTDILPQSFRMRNLSQNDKQIIRHALYGPGNESKIIAQLHGNGNTVTKRSLMTLRPGKWLNDEIINFFMLLLANRDYCFHLKNPTRKRIHVYNSHFFTKLFNVPATNDEKLSIHNEIHYENVEKWSRQVPGKDIFNLDKLFIPVNVNGSHWTLIVVFMQKKRIKYFDSMSGSGSLYCEGVLEYLKDEYHHTKGGTLDKEEWTIVGWTEDIPHQPNGFDCGVFVCTFADQVSLDLPINSIEEEEIVRYGRQRIVLSILNSEVPAIVE